MKRKRKRKKRKKVFAVGFLVILWEEDQKIKPKEEKGGEKRKEKDGEIEQERGGEKREQKEDKRNFLL